MQGETCWKRGERRNTGHLESLKIASHGRNAVLKTGNLPRWRCTHATTCKIHTGKADVA